MLSGIRNEQPIPSYYQEIKWDVIVARVARLGSDAPCVDTAFVIRDYLEEDLKLDSNQLCFKSVVDRSTVWHVWVDHDSQAIDTEEYRKQYKRLYPVGKRDEGYEGLYRTLKEKGFSEELRLVESQL